MICGKHLQQMDEDEDEDEDDEGEDDEESDTNDDELDTDMMDDRDSGDDASTCKFALNILIKSSVSLSSLPFSSFILPGLRNVFS